MYTRKVSYLFTVVCEWEIDDWTEDFIHFVETRKNGQEDCHMGGVAQLVDGKWVLTEGRDIVNQEYAFCADAIEKFFNEHGPPMLESEYISKMMPRAQ